MLKLLERMTDFLGSADRIRIRFDPIVHVNSPDGNACCNLDKFEEIAAGAARFGVRTFSTSWMSSYRKVISRLLRRGFCEIPVSQEQQFEEYDYLLGISSRFGITLHCCSMPGMPVSRCIDGDLLAALHPERLPCSTKKARGQRTSCGCAESLDIGWYSHCPHGCIYCYANPAPAPEQCP
jgi:hypothetical protein